MSMDYTGPFQYLRAVLCLLVAVGYLSVVIFGARRIPLPLAVHIPGVTFMLCAAIKNIGLAFNVYDSAWFVLNELVQAVAIVAFTASLVKIMAVVRHSRKDSDKGSTPASEVE